MLANELVKALESGRYDSVLENIYQESERAKKRYIEAVNEFIRLYGDLEVGIYSAPGRSEIGGNHTDHQHGKVLAAAIDLDMICVVSFQEDGIVQLSSKGYEIKPVDINDLNVHPEQFGTSESLIRGIAKRFSELGKNISGFKGYMISDVLGGSGLSSSAAFESLIGAIFSFGLNEGSVDAVEIAKIGQNAENVYFNKPSGLMDQTACAVGGFVSIDFAGEPVVKQVDFDMNTTGYSLCIVDTKGSHADLTDEYAAMPIEMKMVARYFGKEYLNDVYSDEKAKADIEKVKDKADVIIVAMHWGTEYSLGVNSAQTRVANYLSSLGVNLIIGAHPHVVEPVEYINDGKTFVIYSLGNILSSQIGIEKLTGLMMGVTVKKVVEADGTSHVSIVDPRADLTYTRYSNGRNFKVFPYSQLNDSILPNYQSYYNKYKTVVSSRYPELQWGITGA